MRLWLITISNGFIAALLIREAALIALLSPGCLLSFINTLVPIKQILRRWNIWVVSQLLSECLPVLSHAIAYSYLTKATVGSFHIRVTACPIVIVLDWL